MPYHVFRHITVLWLGNGIKRSQHGTTKTCAYLKVQLNGRTRASAGYEFEKSLEGGYKLKKLQTLGKFHKPKM